MQQISPISFARHYHTASALAGLDGYGLALLSAIDDCKGQGSAQDMIDIYGIFTFRAQLYEALRRLDSGGFISRKGSRRKRLLSITPLGRQVLAVFSECIIKCVESEELTRVEKKRLKKERDKERKKRDAMLREERKRVNAEKAKLRRNFERIRLLENMTHNVG